MEQSYQSLRHLLSTLNRFVDQESTQWKPLEPVESQVQCFKQRSDIIVWLISINDEFGFCDETLFLAVDIFDRFLLRIKTATKYLRCIAITCLYLAAKLNEEDEMIPVTGLMIERSRCGCSESELLRMERCILDKLNWSLISSPTSIQFIHLFDALIRTKCPSLNSPAHGCSLLTSSTLCRALKQCLPHLDLVQYSPSTVALAIISLYLQMTWTYWRQGVDTLQAYSRVADVDLTKCSALVDSYISGYLRESVQNCNRGVLTERNSNTSTTSLLAPLVQHSSQDEEKLMASLSSVTTSSKVPFEPSSNPVSPDPPAKRRRVEVDDDVYSDIRSLYESPNIDEAARSATAAVFVRRFREVTPFMTYAAVVRSSCASQALHSDCAALTASFQQIAST